METELSGKMTYVVGSDGQWHDVTLEVKYEELEKRVEKLEGVIEQMEIVVRRSAEMLLEKDKK
jgi:hypothetical protein